MVHRAQLYEVALPLVRPFVISGGALHVRRSLVVELVDAEGRSGYGESAPFEAPFYSPETLASARACLTEWLLPRVVGVTIADAAELRTRLGDGIRGNRMARAGVETAWWCLRAVQEGRALHDLVTQRLETLGVPPQWRRPEHRVRCGMAIGIPPDRSLRALQRDVEAAVERGYRRVKLKIMPGWDVSAVRAAREVLGTADDVPLTVDGNGAYRLPEHDAVLRALDELGLLFLEQPLPGEALHDLAGLAARLETPVCVDETLTSDEMARQLVAMDGPLVWNLKVQRLGGLEESCRVYARGVAAGARLWVGTMPETGLGAQAGLALAGHAGCVYPSDLEPSERWYGTVQDVVPLVMTPDGTMAVPDRCPPPDLGRARLVYATERKP